MVWAGETPTTDVHKLRQHLPCEWENNIDHASLSQQFAIFHTWNKQMHRMLAALSLLGEASLLSILSSQTPSTGASLRTPDHLRLENINLSKLAPNSSLSKLDTFVGETPAYILNTIAYCQVLSVRHHFLHVLNVPWPRSDKKKWQSCVTRNNNNRALVFVKSLTWRLGWGGGRHHSLPASKIWSYLRKQRNSVTLITKKCI